MTVLNHPTRTTAEQAQSAPGGAAPTLAVAGRVLLELDPRELPECAGLSPEQLADMLAENLHRRDLAGVEEAGGYAQLAMFDGRTPERIAGRIGRPVDRIRAGLAAATVSPDLRPKVAGGALTLEQAAAIEEFAADPKAYARLLRAADYPPGLHHALADERHKVKVADRKEATRVALRDANVRIIAKPENLPWSSIELRLSARSPGACPSRAVAAHSPAARTGPRGCLPSPCGPCRVGSVRSWRRSVPRG